MNPTHNERAGASTCLAAQTILFQSVRFACWQFNLLRWEIELSDQLIYCLTEDGKHTPADSFKECSTVKTYKAIKSNAFFNNLIVFYEKLNDTDEHTCTKKNLICYDQKLGLMHKLHNAISA